MWQEESGIRQKLGVSICAHILMYVARGTLFGRRLKTPREPDTPHPKLWFFCAQIPSFMAGRATAIQDRAGLAGKPVKIYLPRMGSAENPSAAFVRF